MEHQQNCQDKADQRNKSPSPKLVIKLRVNQSLPEFFHVKYSHQVAPWGCGEAEGGAPQPCARMGSTNQTRFEAL
jgi:hypothetical protein